MSAPLFLKTPVGLRLLAVALLLLFAAQAAYVAVRLPLEAGELALASADGSSSALVGGAARLLGAGETKRARPAFVVCGVLLGAFLFYIAERWYGMRCGCLALALYGLSPQMIAAAARAGPAIIAAAAAFSIVVTAMAVAHTLYAPRAVVLWNGRRIVFLAVALALGTAASPATLALVPLAAGYLLYLAPRRRPAALAILGTAVGLAAVLLLLMYSFELSALARALAALGAAPSGLASAAGWRMAGRFYYANGAGCALLLAVSLVAWAASPKARWFGNTSMLISALVAVVAALMAPHAAGVEFLAAALPFLLLFITGSARELLDGRWAAPFSGVLGAALLAQAYFCLGGLLELAR